MLLLTIKAPGNNKDSFIFVCQLVFYFLIGTPDSHKHVGNTVINKIQILENDSNELNDAFNTEIEDLIVKSVNDWQKKINTKK